MKRAIAFAILLFAVSAVAVLLFRSPLESSAVPIPMETYQAAGNPVTNQRSREALPEITRDLRVPLRVRVHGYDKEPISGASALLVALLPSCPSQDEWVWVSNPTEVHAPVWQAMSTETGEIEIPGEYLTATSNYAVWVLHDGHVTSCTTLRKLLTDPRVALKRQISEQKATILKTPDESSRVTLVQYMAALFSTEPESDLHQSARLILRSENLPSDGFRVSPYPAFNCVRAFQGSESTPMVSVAKGDDVTLEFGFSFTASGRVGGWATAQPADGCVEYLVKRGSVDRLVARAEVDPFGIWSLQQLPVLNADEHEFRFLGPGSQVVTTYVKPPANNVHVEVNFEHVPGYTAPVWVRDQSGQPISYAQAFVTFRDRESRVVALSAMTDENGRALIQGLPPVAVQAYATAIGFCTPPQPVQIWPQYPLPQPTTITLLPAGTLQGRVTRNGGPVENFIIWYASRTDGLWAYESFEGARDGEFRLQEVPLGAIELVALAGAAGQSSTVSTHVSKNNTLPAPVELRLIPPMKGLGRVVDALTGFSVDGAHAYVNGCVGGTVVDYRQRLEITTTDGSFNVDSLSAGTARLSVSAPGYEVKTVSAFGGAGEVVDFGTIRLERTQGLRVRLVPDGALRLDWCSATVSGGRTLPTQLFDTDGWLDAGNVVPGPCVIDIVRADRIEERVSLNLPPGRAVVEIPITVGAGMRVVLEEGSGEAFSVRLLHTDGEGWERETSAMFDGAREVDVPVPPAVVREVEVLDANLQRLLRREVSAEERATGVVRIGESAELAVRVVDSRREPIDGVAVLVRRVGGSTDMLLDARTDATGLARVAGVGWSEVEVLAFHPQRGVLPSVRAKTAEYRDEPLELVLDVVGRWSVRLFDGEQALAGVQVRFLDPRHNAGRSQSDAGGTAQSLPFAAGGYRAEVGERGYWPAAAELDLKSQDAETVLQVRRTGSLELVLQSATSPDVSALDIELENLEFKERVSEWLATARVSCASNLRPDENRRVRIDGLPRGKYRWWVRRSDEVLASGEVEVPPHATASEKLFVP
jgi:hypothetical protein